MNITELVDHVELEHERELAPGYTYANIAKSHRDMHGDDHKGGGIDASPWNHFHVYGEVRFK